MDDVRESVKNKSHVIIDVRETRRFEGVYEPIDLVAGHIPTAINVPYMQNLDEKGNFQKPEYLLELYIKIIGDKSAAHVIVHCGSGVTACHTLLAFDVAGLGIPNLYVGSWSEWSRNN